MKTEQTTFFAIQHVHTFTDEYDCLHTVPSLTYNDLYTTVDEAEKVIADLIGAHREAFTDAIKAREGCSDEEADRLAEDEIVTTDTFGSHWIEFHGNSHQYYTVSLTVKQDR